MLAEIEAKRTRRDARVGKELLHQYLAKIDARQSFRPFGFLTKGDHIWFWDLKDYPNRQVADFFAKNDLERLMHIMENRIPLVDLKIKESIVNRSYQVAAFQLQPACQQASIRLPT